MTTGSVAKNIVYFSLPYFFSYFLQTLYGMADLFIIGQFEGAASITAVSIGSQVMHMLTVMIVGLAMGTTVTLAQAVGAEDHRNIRTAIGTTAAMVPLVIAAIPFIGRQVETSLKEVPFGLVEAAQSMGATPAQIIWKVLLPESMSSIVAQLTTVIISLVGESAMAGAVGGGGLGDLAIRYGYQRFRPEIMLATVFILIVLVQLVQFVGNTLAKRLDKR